MTLTELKNELHPMAEQMYKTRRFTLMRKELSHDEAIVNDKYICRLL